MGKRVLLFIGTNIAVMVMVSVVFAALGFTGFLGPDGGLLLVPLAVFSLLWGFGGAFVSLLISRWVAKRMLGVGLVDGQTGNDSLDWLHATVLRLASQAGLPAPEVGIYQSAEVNAFATGPSRKRSLVAVSTGLLEQMDRREVEGVLAHEVAHIANGDMVTMTLIQGVVNAFVIFISRVIAFAVRQAIDSRLAWLVSFVVMIVMQIVLGILGSMVTAWFSRRREFAADAGGAALAGREAMLGALRRLRTTAELVDTREPALAAFKIAGGPKWLKLFATHPDLDKRIAALEHHA